METTQAAVSFWMDIHDYEGRNCRIEQLNEENFGLLADMLSSTELAFHFGRMGEDKSQGGCLLRSREAEGAHVLVLEVPSEMEG
ncbi:hypothetical protein TB15x_20540 [Xanthomonas perforans]|uniref:hypothetical protein n=1 Tax=Xanthomonas perforans TaxID=442694 RepID=UPI00062D392F|nr:hypothetical protein [Xanthomonas perforans]MEB1764630.1 hypothetical protein [Xanthomonas campestris pv. campestris]KLD35812.1 hypothetical protein TB15x_20540 [Xanthomonas perforans]MBZ2461384.1 hypothetical protein [Xanthomonas perforans]MBZ2491378.1 hypothetical protein [Xanthomonas perforans]MBZ2495733.1 hypothetical protein [Xanthomonas perforans]